MKFMKNKIPLKKSDSNIREVSHMEVDTAVSLIFKKNEKGAKKKPEETLAF